MVTNVCAWSVAASSIGEIRLAEGGRMTRPVEAVCIVTNVTQADNGKTGCPYGAGCLVIGCDHQPGRPATEKTETTEVVEVKTLRFTWEGEEHTVKRERVLSRKVKRWTRKDNWVEE